MGSSEGEKAACDRLDCLAAVKRAAREYLDLCGGPGENRRHVASLRWALDEAVAGHEAANAPPPTPRLPGEDPSGDPVWDSPRYR